MRRLMLVAVLALAVGACSELGIDADELVDLQQQLEEAGEALEEAQEQAETEQQEFEDYLEDQGVEYEGPANTANPNRPALPPGGQTEAGFQFTGPDGTTSNYERTIYSDPAGPDFDSLSETYSQSYGEPEYTYQDPDTGWQSAAWDSGTATARVDEGPFGVAVEVTYDE